MDEVTPGFERIIPRGTTMERIPVANSFAEGPVWNARERYLLWTDAFEDRIMRWAPGEAPSTFMQPTGKALALTYDRQGRLVATGWSARTMWRLEPDGSKTVLASHYQGKKINTPNDVVVRSDGSIYWTEPGQRALDRDLLAGRPPAVSRLRVGLPPLAGWCPADAGGRWIRVAERPGVRAG